MANNRSYILYMFAFGLLVPFLVIVVSYVSILRVVKKVLNLPFIDGKHVVCVTLCVLLRRRSAPNGVLYYLLALLIM
jgi:c-opsin